MQETQVQSLHKIPRSRKWQLVPGFLPGKFHGQRSLAGYIVHGATKSQTQLSTYKMGIKKISEQASWLYQYHWGSDPNAIRSTIKGALRRLTWFLLFLDPTILIFLLLLFGPFMVNPWVTFMFFRLQQFCMKMMAM